MTGEIIINGLDMISNINLVNRRKRKYLAIMLNDIEGLVDTATYTQVRKVILDNVNELTRAWLRDAYSGDIEGLDYHI